MTGRRGLTIVLLTLTFALSAHLAAAARAPQAFDAPRAYRDLEKQCAFGPRVPGTAAHRKTADWLVSQLKPLAATVTRQHFTVTVREKRLALTNIIATFNPKGKGHALFCAHWDSRPTADQDPDPALRFRPIAGANDGASGVAVLLEIARALKAHPPAQKVTLVLFDGEDYGPGIDAMFLGSRYFAENYRGAPPDWAVLLDMVGDKDLRIPQEANSRSRAPKVVSAVWHAAAQVGAAAFVPEVGDPIMDDHLQLLNRGIQCIDVIDFTYPYWHTLADTADKCSPASLGQVGRTLLQALAEGGPGSPALKPVCCPPGAR